MTICFAVSWDYLCPFARNAHEHVLAGLEAGADWDVTFMPFSLGEAKVAEGGRSVFDVPEEARWLHALAAGVTVRDHFAEQFRSLHAAMFAARHDEGRDLRDAGVVRDVVREQGLDSDAVSDKFDESVAKIRAAHHAAVRDHAMFGVPTFVKGERAVFVRLMDRPGGDPKRGLETIQGVLQIFDDMPNLNEFKFTKIPR